MNYILEILISSFMILFILCELIRINIFNKDNNALLTGLISLLVIGFGLYLWIKNGLIIDYCSDNEIKKLKAELMYCIAIINILTGTFFGITSIFKLIIFKIKKVNKKV